MQKGNKDDFTEVANKKIKQSIISSKKLGSFFLLKKILIKNDTKIKTNGP